MEEGAVSTAMYALAARLLCWPSTALGLPTGLAALGRAGISGSLSGLWPEDKHAHEESFSLSRREQSTQAPQDLGIDMSITRQREAGCISTEVIALLALPLARDNQGRGSLCHLLIRAV